MAPFLQVKVSVVSSACECFCLNYATDTFYGNWAGFEVVLFVTGMLVNLYVAIKRVTVYVAIIQLEVSGAHMQVTVSAARCSWQFLF